MNGEQSMIKLQRKFTKNWYYYRHNISSVKRVFTKDYLQVFHKGARIDEYYSFHPSNNL